MNSAVKLVVGVDIAKNVFQVYTVDKATGEVFNKQIKRAQFLQWFANRAPCLIGMAPSIGRASSRRWGTK